MFNKISVWYLKKKFQTIYFIQFSLKSHFFYLGNHNVKCTLRKVHEIGFDTSSVIDDFISGFFFLHFFFFFFFFWRGGVLMK